MPIIDAIEAGRVKIVGRRSEGPAQVRPIEQRFKRGYCDDRDGEDHGGHHAYRQMLADPHAGRFQPRYLKPPAVGTETFQQQILNDDRKAEGDQQRPQDVAAQRKIQQPALQSVTQAKHERRDEDHRQQRINAERFRHYNCEVGRQYDEIAMRDVDDAHDPEHERQAGGEKSVQSADQRALDDCIDPIHDLFTRRNTRA